MEVMPESMVRNILCGDKGGEVLVGKRHMEMMSAVLASYAGPEANWHRPPVVMTDELAQPISRARVFETIRRRHQEAQAAAAENGGRRTGLLCGASLRASLVFLRDRMCLDIDMDKLVCNAAAPTQQQAQELMERRTAGTMPIGALL
eukprot:5147446-Pleurochrysis_carterae.AAC.3